MNRILGCAAGACAMFSAAVAHDPATATYLGNEGVLVSHGETKVLFDAFYANGYNDYLLVPDEISKAMMDGAAPYDSIDAIFVSHVHGDHFTAEPTIAYLRAHKDVHFYGPQQTKDAMLMSGVAKDDPVMARIHTYNIAPEHDPVVFDRDGIKVGVVAVPHAGNWHTIQNFVWRVTLDENVTVMHLGDAGPVVSAFSRHEDHFKSRKTNTAFPPYWFLGSKEGKEILDDIIQADQVIGIHVPKNAVGKGDELREQVGGDLFTDPGETRTITNK